ncbi:MAG TPA: sensor histidine kinase, partial [Anaerolineales bacterium]
VLSIQCMQYLRPRYGAAVIGFFTPLMIIALAQSYGVPKALGLGLVYTALNLFLATYALVTQRAVAAGAQNLSLAAQLRDANAKLEAYSRQVEQLAVTRERHRLARELHDSVTQTLFSMNLTVQGAQLLVVREPERVAEQLDRLQELSRSAAGEIQVLVSQLRTRSVVEEGLIVALRRLASEREHRDGLHIRVENTGQDDENGLSAAVTTGLYRITQEALNNVAKHAGVCDAVVRLKLDSRPRQIEIEDHGAGFAPEQVARNLDHIGLAGMADRAHELGWTLQVESQPGRGTCIRVEEGEDG